MTTKAPSKPIILRGELVNNVLSDDAAEGKKGVGKHLQPGIVKYENADGTTITYLLELEGIEAMRPTAAGIPVVGASNDFDHAKIEPGKKYDGKVTDSFWDGESGWEAFSFDGMNAETAKACKKGFQFSCAYIPTETDGTPGKWHNCEYDEKILNGRYTHVAVVPTPRYEGAAIELFNSLGGGIVNESIKKLIRAILPAKDLRELANSAEEDEKKAKKEKLKADFDNAMKNALDEPAKAKAKEDYENGMAAVDKPGAADDSEKKNAAAIAERKNKIAALRNAADAVMKATGDEEKAKPFTNEADKLESLPLGGGEIAPDPGVAMAGNVPQAAVGPEKSAAAVAIKEEGAMNDAPPTDAAALALAEEAKLKAAAGPDVNAQARAAAQENFNIAEAWNSFLPDMLSDGIAGKILVNAADKKILAFNKQPADVQAAWRDAYRGAEGASVTERCNSLKANAIKAVELRNAFKAKAAEDAKKEVERTERFNALKRAADERGGFNGTFPLLGESLQEKAALGAELYG